MSQALEMLKEACLLTNSKEIEGKLGEVLAIEDKRFGALPGSCLREVKLALNCLRKDDFGGATHSIKKAIGFIAKDRMMQKKKSR